MFELDWNIIGNVMIAFAIMYVVVFSLILSIRLGPFLLRSTIGVVRDVKRFSLKTAIPPVANPYIRCPTCMVVPCKCDSVDADHAGDKTL